MRFQQAWLLSLLTACAGPTGYERAKTWDNPHYGYSDKRMGGDEFSVVATGNDKTTKERVARIALLRAARLAQEEGRTHFVIVKQKTELLESAKTNSIPLLLGGVFVPVPIDTATTGEPTSVLIIRLLPKEPGALPPDAIDSAEVISELRRELD